MVRSRRSYTREFKVETVIHPTLIGRWIKQLEVDPEQSFPGKGHLKDRDEEVRRFLSLLRASARSKSGLGRRLPSSSREKMNLSLFCLVSGRQFFNVLILASNSALSSNASYRYNFLFLAMCPSFIFSRAGLCACLLKGRCGSAHRSHSSA